MKKFFVALVASALALFSLGEASFGNPAPIFAQSSLPGENSLTLGQSAKIELFSDAAQVHAGEKFCLLVKVSIPKGWHIYWKNPGEVGVSLQIEWKNPPAGFSFGEWTWSTPTLDEQGGLENFVIEDVAFMQIPVEVSADAPRGEIQLDGTAEWLACNEDSCVPQSASVSVKIEVVDGESVPASSEIVAEAHKSFPQENTEISVCAKGASIGEGEKIILEVSGVPEGIESIRFFPENTEISPKVASQEVRKNSSGAFIFELGASEKITALAGVLRTEAGAFEISTKVSEGAVVVVADVAKKPATVGTEKIEWIEWSPQGQEEVLAEGKILYIDFTARWCATCQVNKRVYTDENLRKRFADAGVVAMRADWTRPNPEISAELRKYNRAAVPFNVFKKSGQPDFILPSAFTGAGTVVDALDNVLRGEGSEEEAGSSEAGTPWFVLAGLAFLGGLILNLMPCVFPVLGLKIMHFVSKSGTDKGKVALHGFIFAFGVLVSFWILSGVLIALRSGGEQLGWGFQMQSPTFVFVMILLLFVFGLSMSGVFEFGTSATGVGGNLVEKSGFAGSFFSGVLAVIVATPCAAPFLAPALGSALSLPPLPSVGIFTCIALGLAFPYVLLSCLPGLLKFLPKPGAWMESFKQAMAFLLYAPAAYFVWVLLGQVEDPFAQRDLILSLAPIALACWIYGRWCVVWRPRGVRIFTGVLAVALFAGTCIYDLTLF